jgi:hypothetical protein
MPTLVVEDGTGLSTANCVYSYADATAYHLARGNAAWAAATQTDCEEAIIAGWQYIENKYRTRWKGSRTNREQALAWPRMASVSTYYTSTTSTATRSPRRSNTPTPKRRCSSSKAWIWSRGWPTAERSRPKP